MCREKWWPPQMLLWRAVIGKSGHQFGLAKFARRPMPHNSSRGDGRLGCRSHWAVGLSQ